MQLLAEAENEVHGLKIGEKGITLLIVVCAAFHPFFIEEFYICYRVASRWVWCREVLPCAFSRAERPSSSPKAGRYILSYSAEVKVFTPTPGAVRFTCTILSFPFVRL